MSNPAEAIIALILIVNGLSCLYLLVEALGGQKSRKARAALIAAIPIVGLLLACMYSSKGRKAQ